jgi:glycosyltransferase involved in cell wall biosynthesis
MITVIILDNNTHELLNLTLKALEKQVYKDFNIVIANPNRIDIDSSYTSTPTPKGINNQINSVVTLYPCNYYATICSGCLPCKDWLKNILKQLKSGIFFVSGPVNLVSKSQQASKMKLEYAHNIGVCTDLITSNYNNLAFTQRAFEQAGGFNADLNSQTLFIKQFDGIFLEDNYVDKYVDLGKPYMDYICRIKLQEEDVKNVINRDFANFAFIDSAYGIYSGNKYSNKTLMYVLTQAGYTVHHYLNFAHDPIELDFYQYKGKTIQNNVLYQTPCDLMKVDVPNAHCYITSPGSSDANQGVQALKLAAKYGKPIFLQLFDCPGRLDDPLLQEKIRALNKKNTENYEFFYREENRLYDQIKKAVQKYAPKIPDLKIIVASQAGVDGWAQWLEIPKDHFIVMHPFVNNRIRDSIVRNPKNQVICINRNAWNKGLIESIEVFKRLYSDWTMRVIANDITGLQLTVSKFTTNRDSVYFHQGVSDADKFIMLKESKLLISNSIYEGFGMWTIEALSCGVPVVCYDLESLRHIDNPNLYRVPKYDVDKFEETVREVLDKEFIGEPLLDYDMDRRVDEIKEQFNYKTTFNSYAPSADESYHISTVNDTTPFTFHFNSIYNRGICTHYEESYEIWEKILHSIENGPTCVNLSPDITVYTFSNKPYKTILELSCEAQGIPLTVLGKDIKTWCYQHKFDYIDQFLNSVQTKYAIFLDSLDCVIYGNVNRILEYKYKDHSVLFNAEYTLYPVSTTGRMEEMQQQRAGNAPMKYLNSGVFFGSVENLRRLYTLCAQYKYEDFRHELPQCKDCDQARFMQVYIDHPEFIQLDYDFRYFYCNDFGAKASDFLILKQND